MITQGKCYKANKRKVHCTIKSYIFNSKYKHSGKMSDRVNGGY